MLDILGELKRCLDAGERVALVTVVRAEGSAPRKANAHMMVRADGSIAGTIGGGEVEFRAIAKAREAIARNTPELYSVHLTRDLGMCCGGSMELYIEPVEAEPTLILFGAGHVGQALAPLGVSLGFKVIVVDEREEYANAQRFAPEVRLEVEDPVTAVPSLPQGSLVYVVVLTHSHRTDEELLRALSAYEYRYVGLIGSKAKVAKFVERLRARGVSDEALTRVHMPIGLNIGAQTPAEIAVSIAAELIQVRRQGEPAGGGAMRWMPASLRAKEGPSGGGCVGER